MVIDISYYTPKEDKPLNNGSANMYVHLLLTTRENPLQKAQYRSVITLFINYGHLPNAISEKRKDLFRKDNPKTEYAFMMMSIFLNKMS